LRVTGRAMPSPVWSMPMGTKKSPLPKYLPDLLAHLERHPPRRGSVGVIEVRHEPQCDLLKHRGPCNCTPVIGDSGEQQ
jgi:hypothetical protein